MLIFSVLAIIAIVIFLYSYSKKEKKRIQNLQTYEKEIAEFSAAFASTGEEFLVTGIPEIDCDIKLTRTEKLYVHLQGVQWMEHRKVTTGYTAHGVTGRVRIAKGLSYRFGTGQIIRENLNLLQPIDNGDLYVTNKGLLFRGAFGNKSIPFDKIVMLSPAINHFKIERDSGKDIYIKFDFKSNPRLMSAIAVAWDSCRENKT